MTAMGFSGVVPPQEAWPLALAEAEQALALDARLPEPRIARAYVRLFEAWEWAFAERELLQAARQNPLSASARQWYGLFLAMRGRLADACRDRHHHAGLPPLPVGDHETEAEQHRRTVELDPISSWAIGPWAKP